MKSGEVFDILIDEIVMNPNQPRQYFEPESIAELAESINQHGLLQPVVVRLTEDQNYELIAGERRLRAFKFLEYDTIPAIVKEMDTKSSAILAMIENIQREDLHYIEVARGYDQLINHYNLTQSELAATLGKGQSTVANKLRLLTLPEDILELLMTSGLTERHGRALLKVKDIKILSGIIKYIIKNDLNVKKTEEYIVKVLEGKPKKTDENAHQVKAYLKDIRLFTNTIKQAVDMVNKSGVDAKYSIKENDNEYTITINVPMNRGE